MGGAAVLRRPFLLNAITLGAFPGRGTTLGSGVVMAFTDEIDLVDVLVRISQFFRDESCVRCVPCRVGYVRQNETMVVLQEKGVAHVEGNNSINDITRVMVDASICGFGHTATNAINSAIKLGLVPETSMVADDPTSVVTVSLTIRAGSRVPEGTSIHKACESAGIDTPPDAGGEPHRSMSAGCVSSSRGPAGTRSVVCSSRRGAPSSRPILSR